MKKKTLTIAIALVLVVALAVGATYAYLTKTTGKVENTFAVGTILNKDGEFVLKEHQATYNKNSGGYDLGETEVDANTYSSVAPKMIVAKDPFVRINAIVETPAYLYVEVVDETAEEALVYKIASEWKQLTDDDGTAVKGRHGGDVYYYVDNKGDAIKIAGDCTNKEQMENVLTVSILKDNQVVIGNVESFGSDADTLSFYGYLYQAVGFGTPLAAYQAVNPADAGE